MLKTENLKDWQLECAFKEAVSAAARAAISDCPTENAVLVANAALAAQRILNPSRQQILQGIIDKEHQKSLAAAKAAGEELAKEVANIIESNSQEMKGAASEINVASKDLVSYFTRRSSY